MCKEMPVIPVNRVVDKEKNNGEKWRVEEQERHKGLLPPPPKNAIFCDDLENLWSFGTFSQFWL
jgi:hypothetical protein